MNNILYCPNCKQPLEELSEEYRSLNVYLYKNGRYIVHKEPEEILVIKCTKCGYTLPAEILRTIENKLPKPF
jgi:uncharacterized protein YbaR (Trm112 family)